MKLNDFETMVNNVIGEIDCSNYAKSLRDMGFNLHFTSNLCNTSAGDIFADLKVGLDGTDLNITIVRGRIPRGIDIAWLLNKYKLVVNRLHKQAVGICYGGGKRAELHKIAINTRYGLNCYVPAAVTDAVLDTARLTCLPYNDVLSAYRRMGLITSNSAGEPVKNNIMEDTDMIFTLLSKENSRGGPRWLAALEPKKIHFNGPATIVEWNDGTKTVVKCQKGDTFDPLTGVAMACMKKMLGTNESHSNYLDDVSKLIDEALEAKNKRYKKKEEALKPKKETNDVSDPDWNVIAEKLDKDFKDKAIDMLLNAIDNTPDNFDSEDKHD